MLKKDAGLARFIAVLSLAIIIGLLIVSSFPMSSNFTASSSSGDVVFMSYTTTNAVGQVVTTQGYVTASTQSGVVTTTNQVGQTTTFTTSTGTEPQSWLTITINGIANLLDPNGNPTQSQTFEIEPLTGGGVADAISLDATYSLEGSGVDWSTLKVDCSSSGATLQPSTVNPDQAETVNMVGTVKQWLGLNSRSGHLAFTSKITDLLGGKSWDKSRKLTAGVGLVCTATAHKLPGYSLVGGTEVSATVGPIVSQTHLKWVEPVVVSPATQSVPSQPSQPSWQPTTTTTTTAATQVVTCTPGRPCYTTTTTTPSLTYSQSTADKIGGGTGAPGGRTGAHEHVSVGSGGGGHTPYELLGVVSPLLEIYGAETDSTPLFRVLAPFAATAIGITVIFFLFKRGKKRRV